MLLRVLDETVLMQDKSEGCNDDSKVKTEF